MQSLPLDKKGGNRLLLTLAGADWVKQYEKERPHHSRRRPDVHLATVCRNVACNYYPVAQEFAISIGRCGRGDTQSHCASGSNIERFDEPQQQQFGQLFEDHDGKIARGSSSPPWRCDDNYVEFVDDDDSTGDHNHLEDDDDSSLLFADHNHHGSVNDHNHHGSVNDHDVNGPVYDHDVNGPVYDHDVNGPVYDHNGSVANHDDHGSLANHDHHGSVIDHDDHGSINVNDHDVNDHDVNDHDVNDHDVNDHDVNGSIIVNDHDVNGSIIVNDHDANDTAATAAEFSDDNLDGAFQFQHDDYLDNSANHRNNGGCRTADSSHNCSATFDRHNSFRCSINRCGWIGRFDGQWSRAHRERAVVVRRTGWFGTCPSPTSPGLEANSSLTNPIG